MANKRVKQRTLSTKPLPAKANSTGSTEPLFLKKSGNCYDYGTNATLELLDKIPSQIVEMKLDDVLTAVKTLDNLCDYKQCGTKVNLIGQDCCHCQKRFCFKHGLPEIHGCGEAIKRDERKKFLQPKPAKTLREEQDLSHAKKKLNEKLKNMQVDRLKKSVGGTKK